MLTIRNDQMQILIAQQRATFVAELSSSLLTAYPEMRKGGSSESSDPIRRAVEQCIDDARSLGFTTRSDLARYSLFALNFGRHFISDPLLPWAVDALEDSGAARMPRLKKNAEAFSRSVLGAGNRFSLAACERWILGSAMISAGVGVSHLQAIFPEKAAAAGPEALRQFVVSATSTMDEADIRDGLTREAFMVCGYLLGHRCHEDPFLKDIGSFFRIDTALRFREHTPRFHAAVLAACRRRIPTAPRS